MFCRPINEEEERKIQEEPFLLARKFFSIENIEKFKNNNTHIT